MTSLLTTAASLTYAPKGPTDEHYDYAFDDWITLRDVVKGQRRVKEQRERYLPRRSKMNDEDYKGYLSRASFFGITGKTLESLLGSIFRRPSTFALPDELSYLIDSCTPDGVPLQQLVETIASEALLVARVGILIDMPAQAGSRADNPFSLITTRSTRNLPYFALYRTEYIMDWKLSLDPYTNEQILTRVVLAEYPDSKSEENMLRILELVPSEISSSSNYEYRQYTAKPDSPEVPETPPVYPTKNGARLSRIPFFFVCSDGTGPFPSDSPLKPIADLNISHYQSTALLESARTFVGTPQYWIKGAAQDQDEFLVSSQYIWKLGPDDDVGIIEFNGHGLTFLENALQQKEQQMSALGAKLFGTQKRQAAISVQQIQQTQNSEESILLKLVNTINYQMTRIMKVIGWWLDLSDSKIEEILIELNKNFDSPTVDARTLRSLQSLYETGLFPLSMMYLSFKDAGMVPGDMSMEEFKTLVVSKGETPSTGGPQPQALLAAKMSLAGQVSAQSKASSSGPQNDGSQQTTSSNSGDGNPDQQTK